VKSTSTTTHQRRNTRAPSSTKHHISARTTLCPPPWRPVVGSRNSIPYQGGEPSWPTTCITTSTMEAAADVVQGLSPSRRSDAIAHHSQGPPPDDHRCRCATLAKPSPWRHQICLSTTISDRQDHRTTVERRSEAPFKDVSYLIKGDAPACEMYVHSV
jgi:hypothetical protein